eukprot:TRINITY_DN11678_c0_g1_i5.p1 TRINITY_DN11678_c0_g1~~TRINITY_DN11678_c0_g1_i5.p1  ORF type:complete len:533 (-),score=153.47 TRINITY_DN11678_c0_g1_i5:66-1664(-)
MSLKENSNSTSLLTKRRGEESTAEKGKPTKKVKLPDTTEICASSSKWWEREIVTYLQEKKEAKKNRSAEEKKKEKDEKAKRDQEFGFAIVDGVLEKVGGYVIEAPTLFKGRGKHPKAGLMKARIMPEELTINVAENAPVPRCLMPGHSWGNIVNDNTVTWLAFYKDDTINTTHKYIYLAASSKFKGLNDKMKYEKARRLKDVISKVRSDYDRKLKEKDIVSRQLGTATYLIDRLALRVGNEKGEDEADTVGCCSLRFEHVKAEPGNKISLDFLGKDSMRYCNTVEVEKVVWENIRDFLVGKSEGQDLLDRISAPQLNDYLKSLMEGLTAKVFRTYNASTTLQSELLKKPVTNLDVDAKVEFYNEANKQVAILCNHQRTVSKNFEEQKGKLSDRIIDMEEYIAELHEHIKKVERMSGAERDRGKAREKEKEQREEATREKGDWHVKRKFPYEVDKTKKAISNCEKQLKKLQAKLKMKEDTKEIALGTSKINYNDPRITVAWAKSNEVPIEKLFPKTLRSKFVWAMYAEPSWRF